MEPRTERVVLILADISGYTRFMLASQTALVHGQQVITELLEAIIHEVEIPLEVKEIEGDAVFLYAVKPGDEASWEAMRRAIGRKLERFFAAFSRTLLELSETALCRCGVCENLDQLKLKIVVHSGEALFHRIGRFPDVSGVDVILAHRLLKNSVASDEYVLMSEAAHRDLGDVAFGPEDVILKGEESYEGFGSIVTYTRVLAETGEAQAAARARVDADPVGVFAGRVRRLVVDYLGQFPLLLGAPPGAKLDLPELPDRPARRMALALVLAVLMPAVLLAGAAVEACRIVTRRRRAVPAS